MTRIENVRDLRVYRTAYRLAQRIFTLSSRFPKEELYALTGQIRGSSRSVCANLAEAWRKRRYPAAFVAKLNDAEAEAAETRTWLTFAAGCGYLEKEEAAALDEAYDHVLAQLVTMAQHPEHWCVPRAPTRPLTPSPPRSSSSAGNPDHP